MDNTKGSGVIGEIQDETATIKGNLDFTVKYRIKNLPVPVDEKDGVNREYVDLRDESLKTELLTSDAFEFKDNIFQAKGNLDMSNAFTINNIKDPVDEKDIVDKKYVDEMDELNSAFALRNGGYYAKGTIYLRKNKLGGLREPIQDEEATTKKYVDNLVSNHFVDENDNITFGRDVDMEGNKIFSLPEPEQDSEPTTKKYVDDLQNQYIDKRGNMKFSRNINLDNKRIFALKEPKRDNEATNKKYVDESITKRLQEEKDNFLPQDPATKEYVDEAIKGLAGGDLLVSKEGVFIKANGHYRATAPLDIDNHKMENLPDPVDEKDAVNKKYVDDVAKSLTLEEALIKENGGYNITKAYLNMNFNNIRNVGNPQNKADAVPRSFVDDMIKEVEEKVYKRKQLITASASYHGDLIKGDYQFTWSGQSVKSYKKHDVFNGFLMPHSGYIKRFVLEDFGLKINPSINTIFKNIPIPLFTLVVIKNNKRDEIVDLGTLNIIFDNNIHFDNENVNPMTGYTYTFISNVGDLEKYPFSTKDVLNIRTEFETEVVIPYNIEKRGYEIKDTENEFYTYLATVLIELDLLDD